MTTKSITSGPLSAVGTVWKGGIWGLLLSGVSSGGDPSSREPGQDLEPTRLIILSEATFLSPTDNGTREITERASPNIRIPACHNVSAL